PLVCHVVLPSLNTIAYRCRRETERRLRTWGPTRRAGKAQGKRSKMTRIVVVAMGQMGAAMAGRLVENGAEVVTSLGGRSAASVERAKAAGVKAIEDPAAL